MGASLCCAEEGDTNIATITNNNLESATIAVAEVAGVPLSRENTAFTDMTAMSDSDITENLPPLSRPPLMTKVSNGVTGRMSNPYEAAHHWGPYGVIQPQGAITEAITPITVTRTATKERLGLELRHLKTRLVVMEVRTGQAVHAHNKQQTDPEQVIQIGDVIVQINSVEGDDAGMIEECRKSSNITFYVRRWL
mmetsp:Transcript_55715/g.130382  ORF Transcript_55715/g.130382 Transcript_55715/m.130382 type:complete len:194 (-) Transcript_55715:46-627(-)